jgi:hypothetical protein
VSESTPRTAGQGGFVDGRALLELTLASVERVNALVFFRSHPGVSTTARGVATEIGGDADEVVENLEALGSVGILASTNEGGVTLWHRDPQRDEEVQALVAEYIEKVSHSIRFSGRLR